MKAGKLNQRITIQRREDTTLPSGQRKAEWKPWKTLWAQVRTTDSKAADETGAIQHESVVKFHIRRTEGINAEMRVLYRKRVFELTGAPVDWEDERGMTLLAKERV